MNSKTEKGLQEVTQYLNNQDFIGKEFIIERLDITNSPYYTQFILTRIPFEHGYYSFESGAWSSLPMTNFSKDYAIGVKLPRRRREVKIPFHNIEDLRKIN